MQLRPARAAPAELPLDDVVWVFAYGSLMWNPGFAFVESRAARLHGYHRSFCVYSHHYRGTADRPGLVLGLDRGGDCHGMGLRIDPLNRDAVVAYLNERELVGYAYRPTVVRAEIGGREVPAYTFVADPTHCQYAGDLGCTHAAEIIMAAEGRGGLNRDYLINLIDHLEAMGIVEPELHALLAEIQHMTGLIDQGGGI